MSSQQNSNKLADHLLVVGQQEASWIVRLNDQTEKTFTIQQIVEAYNDRLIDPESYVWTDGMSTWQQLQAVDPIVEALHAAAEPPPAPGAVAVAAPQQASASSNATGGSSNDSAIFSLANLVGSPQQTSGAESSEDSGLIDLAALQAAASASQPPEAAPVLTQGLFAPAEAAPAPAVQVSETPVRSNGGGDKRVVFGLLGAVALLAGVVVFLVMKRPDDAAARAGVEPTSAVSSAVPVQPAAQADPAKPEGSAVAQNDPAPAGASSAAPSAASSSTAKAIARTSPPTRSAAARRDGPLPETRKVTPQVTKKGCNCPPEDLMCSMRCATKK